MPSVSITELEDGRYTVRWRTPDGRQPRRTFTTKRAAERHKQKVLTDLEAGVNGARRGETLGTALAEWWSTVQPSLRPRTIERYDLNRKILTKRFGSTPLDQVTYERIQSIVQSLSATPYSPRTVASIYGVLALCLKDAALKGKIRPVTKPPLPKVEDPDHRVPTRDEVERLAAAVDAQMMAMVIVAGYCGLREGELLALERRDVHLDEARIWIHQAVNKTTQSVERTKTKASRRWVVLPERAREVLTAHLNEHPGDRVFPLTPSAYQKRWDIGRQSCSLKAVRFHDLRHAAASMMIAAGWNIMQVSRQLGHSKPSMTLNTYGFLFPESFEDALQKIDAYLAH